jgi:serine/threonine protein kinase
MVLTRCNSCFSEYEGGFEICPHCGYVCGAEAKELYHLFPGTILHDRYIIGEVLGYGGFGITYKAWDKNLAAVMAVKEYYPSSLVNRVPGTKEVVLYARNRHREFNHGLVRFIDEARSMAKFKTHKNIINVFEYFEENNSAYIVMEFLDGIPLSAFLKTDRMAVDTCVDMVGKVCAALKDVHAQKIIHRDISPDNVFLCLNGQVKLIDFGAARFADDEDKLMTVIVKPGFAPPEQYETVNVQGPWTDIYAVGAMLYYMITGMKPEESTNRKTEDTLQPPHLIDPQIPENTSNTIMKAMAIDRHLRFATITDFERALLGEKKIVNLAKEKKRRKIRRGFTMLAALLIVAISATLFYTNYDRQRQEEILAPASISVAFPLSGDEEHDEARQAALEAIIEGFLNSAGAANVEIELLPIPHDEYEAAISSANPPTLFYSSGLEPSALQNTVELGGLTRQLNIENYYFLDDYSQHFPNENQFPLGFVAPVLYINTTFGEASESDATLDRQLFLDGEAPAFLSTTADFFAVREALPGRYRLAVPANTDADFAELWSISDVADSERRAAERLLAYFLSDIAQDYIFIRSRSDSLPLNRRVIRVFSDVYNEFDGFFEGFFAV